jgi:hypothetical protein
MSRGSQARSPAQAASAMPSVIREGEVGPAAAFMDRG